LRQQKLGFPNHYWANVRLLLLGSSSRRLPSGPTVHFCRAHGEVIKRPDRRGGVFSNQELVA
jgi:hypothetical protein